MRTLPWVREDLIARIRADLWRYLTPAASIEGELLQAAALLQITARELRTLARLAREVFSVERFADLADTARVHLAGRKNVTVVVGDGSAGLPEHAPFDAILVAAAYPSVPAPLAKQLAEGGRLVQPLGPGGAEDVVLFEKHDGELNRVRSITSARFVRLHGAHGFP
jgi:protein-L-isoaspartate(D-aspartate) O-methyltransferase